MKKGDRVTFTKDYLSQRGGHANGSGTVIEMIGPTLAHVEMRDGRRLRISTINLRNLRGPSPIGGKLRQRTFSDGTARGIVANERVTADTALKLAKVRARRVAKKNRKSTSFKRRDTAHQRGYGESRAEHRERLGIRSLASRRLSRQAVRRAPKKKILPWTGGYHVYPAPIHRDGVKVNGGFTVAKALAKKMGHPAAVYNDAKGRFVGYIGRTGKYVPTSRR